jgi:hypothetical protein
MSPAFNGGKLTPLILQNCFAVRNLKNQYLYFESHSLYFIAIE